MPLKGGRHGISDGAVCALRDAAHDLDVAGDPVVNTACAHLGTSGNTRNQRACLLIWTVVAISQSSSANSHLNHPAISHMTKLAMLHQYIDRSLAAIQDESSHLSRPPIVKLVSENAIIRMKLETVARVLQSRKNQCLDP